MERTHIPSRKVVIDEYLLDDQYTDYLRRLLIERHVIRAKLLNPGGSVILHGASLSLEGSDEYSAVIGNDFHLDILEMENMLKKLSKNQRQALLEWADGKSEEGAKQYTGIRPSGFRKRRERGLKKLTEKMKPDEGRGQTG